MVGGGGNLLWRSFIRSFSFTHIHTPTLTLLLPTHTHRPSHIIRFMLLLFT